MIVMKKSGVRSPVPGEGGFTLIETVITLIVLSIAVIGVLSVFTTGIQGSADPLLVDQAVQLAQGEMDRNIGEKIANTFNSPNLAANIAPVACLSSAAFLLPGFTCGRTVCFVPASNLNDISNCTSATNYKHVTVTITQAAIGTVTMDTVVTNY